MTPPRSFLFLQGPQSYFFERLGRLLMARGHRVQRINLNLGDRLFWRLPAYNFRDSSDVWPNFIETVLEKTQATDIVLHGDTRPYHIVAGEIACAQGVAVHVTDLGYLRPGWLTLEPDGMTSRSRFPRDATAIRALAQRCPAPDLAPRAAAPFRLLAGCDVAYNLASTLGRPLFPGYRRHGLYHPLAEYAGWIGNAPGRLARRRRTEAEKQRLAGDPRGYFLYPLQLATDFQLRAHSPFADARDALRLVLRSFSESGGGRRLAVVAHPLDEGLVDWRRLVRRAADERVLFFDGGVPDALLANAAGIVTVNSTIGLAALRCGVPVKTLGSAIYDVAGLTHAGELAGFWRDPQRPDHDFLAVFLRALIGATQVKGDYHTPAGQAEALPAFVEHLERRPVLSSAPEKLVG